MKLRGAEEEEISGFDTQYFGFGVFLLALLFESHHTHASTERYIPGCF